MLTEHSAGAKRTALHVGGAVVQVRLVDRVERHPVVVAVEKIKPHL